MSDKQNTKKSNEWILRALAREQDQLKNKQLLPDWLMDSLGREQEDTRAEQENPDQEKAAAPDAAAVSSNGVTN